LIFCKDAYLLSSIMKIIQMKKLFTLALVVFATTVFAQTQYFTKDGAAISGYDPVAYFTDNAAVKGTAAFSYDWNGTTWQFKNQVNLDAFKSNPQKYAPQFGGYCAYGVSEDHKSPTEPTAFTVVGDKLYLNYNMKVLELWRKDMDDRIVKGDKNWVKLKDRKE